MKFLKRWVRRSMFTFLHKSFNVLVIFAFMIQPFGATGFNVKVLASEGDVTVAEPTVATPAEIPAPKEEKVAPVVEEKVVTPPKEAVVPAETPVVTPKIETIVPVETPVVALAEEATPVVTPTETTLTETPIETAVTSPETPTDTATVETPTPTETPVTTEVTPATETIVPAPVEVLVVAPVIPEETWDVQVGNKATTNSSVELGKVYVAPQNDQVTVTFTKLPEKVGTLSIEEITLTPEQVKTLGALSNKAYDITSDMVDGTFAYDLTLPKSADQKNVEIKFAETMAGLKNADTVATSDINTETTNSISASLDHFTIFVVVNPLPIDGPACIAAGADTGTDCFVTIQAAVAAASSGDTIKIAAGTYAENVSIPTGKTLTIQGQGGTAYIAAANILTLASDVTLTNFSPATSGTSIQINPGGKIQDGVNFAVSGSTINVAAGTYHESQIVVWVNKGFTLQGAGAGVTTIDGDNAAAVNLGVAYGNGIHPGTIYVKNPDTSVKIDGFTFINPVTTAGEITSIAIAFGSGAPTPPLITISNNKFTGVSTGSNNLTDNAIWVDTAPAGVVSHIENNEFEHQWQSILLTSPKGGAVVTGNNFHNLFTSGGFASQAMSLWQYGGTNVTAPVTISTNTFSASDGWSIVLRGGGSGNGQFINNVTIANNTITGTGANSVGIVLRNPAATLGDAALDGIVGATISGNTITSSVAGQGKGIWLRGPNNNTTITDVSAKNTISGFATGILSEQYNVASTSSGVVVNGNSITNNTIAVSNGGTSIDATSNWWGSADPAFATIISGTVNHDPWYIDAGKGMLSSTLHNIFTTVASTLSGQGVASNIGDVTASNFTSFSGLYFEKRTNIADATTAKGRITFNSALDLSDSETQTFLQNLGTKLDASTTGLIGLNFTGATSSNKLKGVSATIKFYGLNTLGFDASSTADEINAKLVAMDDSGNVIDKATLVTEAGTYLGACEVGGGCYVFSVPVSHFTKYKVDEKDKTTPNASGDATLSGETTQVVLTDVTKNVTVDVASGTENPTIDVSAFVSLVDGEQTGTLPEITITSDVADVTIPDNTIVTGPSGWDGVIDAPTEGTPAGGDAPAGFAVGGTVITLGSPDGTLTFNTAVTIVLPGVTGTVGYRPSGSTVWQEITNVCTGTYENPTGAVYPGECAISNGTDTKILTFHFTSFGELLDTQDPDNVESFDAIYKQSPNRVQLTWNVKDSDIDMVYIYRGKSKNFSVNTSTRIAKNSRNDTNFSDYNVTPGEKYYYKAVAVDKAGNKSNVKVISVALPTEGTVAVVTNEGTEVLPAGTVLGAETTNPSDTVTTSPNTQTSGKTTIDNKSQNGKVLGADTTDTNGDNGGLALWQWLLFVFLLGGAGYYGVSYFRKNRNPLS